MLLQWNDCHWETALQFEFPFYLWFLCGLLIYFSRHFSVVSRIAGKHSVRLLATVILLSYAKIIKTVIDVIWPSTIFQVTNSNDSSTHYQTVWKMNGTVQYLHGHHRILFVFVVIVGICTLPYTLSLLFIQCLKKVSHYRVLFWVVKLKPLFDAYTNPFLDWFSSSDQNHSAIASNTTKGPILSLCHCCHTLTTVPGWSLQSMASLYH